MEYLIYHGTKQDRSNKIGVTTELDKRVKKQSLIDFYVLEEHADIYEVSDREQELQNIYGYEVDDIPYWKSVQNIKLAHDAIRGKSKTKEHKRKLSEAEKGITKPKIECPHCGKQGGKPIMNRWHFDNCKHKHE